MGRVNVIFANVPQTDAGQADSAKALEAIESSLNERGIFGAADAHLTWVGPNRWRARVKTLNIDIAGTNFPGRGNYSQVTREPDATDAVLLALREHGVEVE